MPNTTYRIGRFGLGKPPDTFIALDDKFTTRERVRVKVGRSLPSDSQTRTSLCLEVSTPGSFLINGQNVMLDKGKIHSLNIHDNKIKLFVKDLPGALFEIRWLPVYVSMYCSSDREISLMKNLKIVDFRKAPDIQHCTHLILDKMPDPATVLLALSKQIQIFDSKKWIGIINRHFNNVKQWYFPREDLLPEYADITYLPNKLRKKLFHELAFFTFDLDLYSEILSNMGANVWNFKINANDLNIDTDIEINLVNDINKRVNDVASTFFLESTDKQVNKIIENVARCFGTNTVGRKQIAQCLMYVNRDGLKG